MSFFESLKDYADITENRLSQILNQKDGGADRLNEAISYSALGGGKRLRAYLVLEFCNMLGIDKENALDYACAIEMIQAFSLIHDDLPAMDNDDMRRGKPSNHKAFGEATAILAGDSLALDSFAVAGRNAKCNKEQNADAVISLAEKSGSLGMCGGQQIDIDSEGKRIELEELLRLVDLKTGALFSCACTLGCIAANASEEQKKAANDFGLLCGRAFQITDDLLDINSTAEELGKTVGKDELQEKSTFPSLLTEKGAFDYAENYIEKAKKLLAIFPDNQAKTNILEFCDYILIRKK